MLAVDTIICGDNVATMATFPDACIDLVVTSPPYDNLRTYGGHSWDFEGVAKQLWRVIKPGGVVVWIVADATINGSETGTSFRQALRFMEIGFRLHDTMVWEKTGQGACGSNLAYWQNFEFMFVLSSGRLKSFNPIEDRKNVETGRRTAPSGKNKTGKWQRVREIEVAAFGRRYNHWTIAAEGNEHPAPFPEALARDHILSWSNEGDIVLDPFAGSFTTCKMARLMGRRWIGIEINPAYCEIGRTRMKEGLLPFMGPQVSERAE